MNDLFRALFGIPSNDNQGEGVRVGPNISNDSNNDYSRENDNYGGYGGYGGPGSNFPLDNDVDEDDETSLHPERGIGFFGFPLFKDSFDFHKQFDKLVEEMHKSFGIFGFGGGPSISWEDGNSEISSTFLSDPPLRKTESLRDAYLKQPDCGCEANISGRENVNSRLTIDNAYPGPSSPVVQQSTPKIYSKSVFIQSIRKPDGSVETIKKVRDHTGNEETTITQTNINDSPLLPPPNDPELPPSDTSGLSLLKKFFNF